jgi:DNA repair protein RAD50
VLKKKFDEIFSATRYTKALENIRSKRKDMTGELKLDTQLLEQYQKDRGRAATLQSDLDAMVAAQARNEERIHVLEIEYQELSGELKRVMAIVAESELKRGMIKSLQHGIEHAIKARKDLEEHMEKEFEESEEELHEMLETQRCAQNERHETLDEQQALRAVVKMELDQARSELNQMLSEQGKLVARQEEHGEQVKERDAKVRAICTKYGFEDVRASTLTPEHVAKFNRLFQNWIAQKENELERVQVRPSYIVTSGVARHETT